MKIDWPLSPLRKFWSSIGCFMEELLALKEDNWTWIRWCSNILSNWRLREVLKSHWDASVELHFWLLLISRRWSYTFAVMLQCHEGAENSDRNTHWASCHKAARLAPCYLAGLLKKTLNKVPLNFRSIWWTIQWILPGGVLSHQSEKYPSPLALGIGGVQVAWSLI